jgi:hypothetical protein
MTHSVKKRKQRKRVKQALERRVKDIQRLASKHEVESERVTLSHVSLGDLRRRFSPRNPGFSALHPALKRMDYQNKFTRYPSDRNKPLEIRGSDGGLLFVRTRMKDSDAITKLSVEANKLPPPKHYKFRGKKRSDYHTLHLGTWAPYSPKCIVTRELRQSGPIAFQFLKEQEPIWTEMSRVLGQYAPGVFKQSQLYPVNDPCERFCGAWYACVVNNGGNKANQTEAHRDVKESLYGYSCVITAGDFRGGALVCYELGVIIELEPGDIALFPDALVTHKNEEAEGHRISVVTFTQENMYDYWHRNYKMKLRRKTRKRIQKAKKSR